MATTKNSYKIIGLAIIISLLIIGCNFIFPAAHIPVILLLSTNIFFCILTILVYLWIEKSRSNKNPNVFVRRIMSGMFLKMIVTVLGVVVLVNIHPNISSKELLISLSFYLFYLFMEVRMLLKSNNS